MGTPKRGQNVALLLGFSFAILVAVIAMASRKELRANLLWRAFESLSKNAQGYPEYRHRQTGIVFVSLPGGTFAMGSPEDEEERESHEGPVHDVTLSPFLIAKYEVSQAEWTRVMKGNPSVSLGGDLPVDTVSWGACRKFCADTGLALPTEAQWEYACRAGTIGPYAGPGDLDAMGWYQENSGGATHPVGGKRANDFGLHDMHGNVWEWCEDALDEEFYKTPTATQKNPVCKSKPELRVIRGGSWFDAAGICRSALRYGDDPSLTQGHFGVRLSSRSPGSS